MNRKIIVSIVLISCVLTLGIYTWYRVAYHMLIQKTEHTLEKIATTKVKEIIDYIAQQKTAIEKLAHTEPIINALSTPDHLDQEQLKQFISSHRKVIVYDRVLLVTPDGTFIFSTADDAIVGKKMTPQDYLESYFSESFVRALMSATIDFAAFEIDSLFNEPTLFVCAPVFKDKRIIGILAVQLDEEKVYNILQTYDLLGTSDEIVLGKPIPSGSLVIAPTRHAPNIAFKQQGAITEPPALLQRAVSGAPGTGIGLDYRGQVVVGAWRYIPLVNWGLVVKQDLAELKAQLDYLSIVYYILLCMSIIMCFWFLFYYHHQIHIYLSRIPFFSFMSHLYPRHIYYSILLLIIIACCCTFIALLFRFNNQKKSLVSRMESFAQKNINTVSINIEDYLRIVQLAAETIVDDLNIERLQTKDIEKRIQHNLAEYWYEIASITIAYEPYAYDKSIEHYARSLQRNSDGTFVQERIENYHTHPLSGHTDWYEKTIKQGAQWFDPVIDLEQKDATALYTVPFFWPNQQKIRGVLAIRFNLQFIFDAVREILIGKMGYAFLIDSKGTFFHHPVSSYIKNKKTIVAIAQEQRNTELENAVKDMLAGNSAQHMYVDQTTQQKIWLIYKTLKPTQWVLAISFPEQQVTMNPQIIRHTMIWLLIIAFIALLCIVLLIIMITIREYYTKQLAASIGITISALLGLLVLWFIIVMSSQFIETKGIVITQSTGLDRLVQEIEQESQRKNEPVPTPTSVGLLIYSLFFPDPHHIGMTARIWQQYNPQTFNDNVPGIQIPNAKQATIKELFKETDKGQNIIGWKLETLLPQNYNYRFFPFDILHTVIPLEQSDITKNLLLIPDLQSYARLAPKSLPGIQESLSVSGFAIQQSFFSLEPVEPITNFGMASYDEITDRTLLHYNIIMTRDLLNPLVLYFLPLLVVLISLFAIFWLISQKDAEDIKKSIFTVLGAYSGLFFALILLHRNLRSEYPVGEILYIEYLFFFTYLTILLFIMHGVFLYAYSQSDRIRSLVSHVIALLFWPAQLILWFITTIIIFY